MTRTPRPRDHKLTRCPNCGGWVYLGNPCHFCGTDATEDK